MASQICQRLSRLNWPACQTMLTIDWRTGIGSDSSTKMNCGRCLESKMTRDSAFMAYCRFYKRLREILYEAPWSSFDLIMASVVFWLGVYFSENTGLFDQYGGVYHVMARLGSELVWGTMFCFFGIVGMLNTLWLSRPPFSTRMLSRMGVAFCLTSLAINNLGNTPPLASSITYCVLSLSALWSVWRTKSSGR